MDMIRNQISDSWNISANTEVNLATAHISEIFIKFYIYRHQKKNMKKYDKFTMHHTFSYKSLKITSKLCRTCDILFRGSVFKKPCEGFFV